MNDNVIVLTRYKGNVLFVSIEEGRTAEYQLFSADDDIIGSIYVCEIKDVVKNIGASFVNYGNGKTGFLKETKYKKGTLIPLELKRAGTKDKAPLFEDEYSLAGLYTVVTDKNRSFSISKKLPAEKRDELRNRYSGFFSDLEYGITLRTNSANAGLTEVIKEADELAGIIDEIIENGSTRTVGTVMYKPANEWIKYCYKTDILSLDKIITDDTEIYSALKTDVIGRFHEINPKITLELYNDKMLPLNKLYSIDSGIEEALNRRVWLKCGGYLYIESTEALTAIDVNSGRNVSDRNKENTVYECNIEATDEICRQIRLRGIGGIIIIDYINMTDHEHIKGVVDRLKKGISRDSVKTEYHDMTALSLVELTRMKIREPFKEQLKKAENGEGNNG